MLSLARQGKQAIFGLLVGFYCPITQDVGDFDSALDKTAADKQAAMAYQRFVFAAHEREPGAGRDLLDLCDALGKQRAGRHQIVVGNAAVLWASSQFAPQEDVVDAGAVETILQRSAVEVGQPRCRARPDVRDRTDVGFFQQSLESLPIVIRVPNAENERHLV